MTEPEWTKDHIPEWIGSDDWMQISIIVPNNKFATQLLKILTDLGFIEYDWCELYHPISGSLAGYAPATSPTYEPGLIEYIERNKESGKQN